MRTGRRDFQRAHGPVRIPPSWTNRVQRALTQDRCVNRPISGDRKVAWNEVRDPVLKEPSDAIARPVAATTCDVDKMILAGKSPVPPPFAIGPRAGDISVAFRRWKPICDSPSYLGGVEKSARALKGCEAPV